MAVERSDSPLETIRAKELEISRRLEADRREADAELSRVRGEVAGRLASARQDAAAAAQTLLEKAISSAEDESNAIRFAAQEDAAGTWERSRGLIPAVAGMVVGWVLPEVRPALPSVQREEDGYATPHGQGPADQHAPPS